MAHSPPPTALVVDDEADLRALTAHRLRRAGFVVHVARDGEDGWDKTHQHHPDVLVLDVRMPRLDGVGLTRRVREDEQLRDTGIVLLTASVAEDEEVAAQHAGADSFIRKPCTTEELMIAVRDALASHAAGQDERR